MTKPFECCAPDDCDGDGACEICACCDAGRCLLSLDGVPGKTRLEAVPDGD